MSPKKCVLINEIAKKRNKLALPSKFHLKLKAFEVSSINWTINHKDGFTENKMKHYTIVPIKIVSLTKLKLTHIASKIHLSCANAKLP